VLNENPQIVYKALQLSIFAEVIKRDNRDCILWLEKVTIRGVVDEDSLAKLPVDDP